MNNLIKILDHTKKAFSLDENNTIILIDFEYPRNDDINQLFKDSFTLACNELYELCYKYDKNAKVIFSTKDIDFREKKWVTMGHTSVDKTIHNNESKEEADDWEYYMYNGLFDFPSESTIVIKILNVDNKELLNKLNSL